MSYDKHPNESIYDPDATTKSFHAWAKADKMNRKIDESTSNITPPQSETKKRNTNNFYSPRASHNGRSWRNEDPVSPDIVPRQ